MKALRQSLLDLFTVALEPLGFRRSQQSFLRDFPGGCEVFHLAFIPQRTDFDLTADVAVRYDSIEEQLNSSTSTRPPDTCEEFLMTRHADDS